MTDDTNSPDYEERLAEAERRVSAAVDRAADQIEDALARSGFTKEEVEPVERNQN